MAKEKLFDIKKAVDGLDNLVFSELKRKLYKAIETNKHPNRLMAILQPYILPTIDNCRQMCKVVGAIKKLHREDAKKFLISQLYFDPNLYSESAMREYVADLKKAANLGYNEFLDIELVKAVSPKEYYTVRYSKGDKVIYRTDIIDRVYKVQTKEENTEDWVFEDGETVPADSYPREIFTKSLSLLVKKEDSDKDPNEILESNFNTSIYQVSDGVIEYGEERLELNTCSVLIGKAVFILGVPKWVDKPMKIDLKDLTDFYKYYNESAELATAEVAR